MHRASLILATCELQQSMVIWDRNGRGERSRNEKNGAAHHMLPRALLQPDETLLVALIATANAFDDFGSERPVRLRIARVHAPTRNHLVRRRADDHTCYNLPLEPLSAAFSACNA